MHGKPAQYVVGLIVRVAVGVTESAKGGGGVTESARV